MSSDSDASIEVEDVKPVRRSSIFRPDADNKIRSCLGVFSELFNTEPSQRFNDLTTTIFPSNYTQKLLDENIKWKETYSTIKSDVAQLKKKALEDARYPVELNNLSFFKTYLTRAEEFCCQVNNVLELHENAINFQNIQTEEVTKQVEIISHKLT